MEATFRIPGWYASSGKPSLLDGKQADFTNLLLSDTGIAISSDIFFWVNEKFPFTSIKKITYGNFSGFTLFYTHYLGITLSKDGINKQYFFPLTQTDALKAANLLKDRNILQVDNPPYFKDFQKMQYSFLIFGLIIGLFCFLVAFSLFILPLIFKI